MSCNLINKVSDTIKKFNMFDKGEKLLVCLSGGADSTTLLLCLYKLGYNVSACHINHQLRGEESERDQIFCENLCKSINVRLGVYRIDVKDYCAKNSVSIEEGGRILRYQIFDSIGADKICTAHSLSDCLETTIFNLARGTGIKGLCSIPAKRDNVVRPLIECTREEIEEFLEEEKQSFVTDSSNLTDEYTRNKIRHNVVPVLKQINSSLMKTYSDTLGYLREDNDFLEKTADSEFDNAFDGKGLILDRLEGMHNSIKSRVIMRFLSKNDIGISHDTVRLVEESIQSQKKLCLTGNIYLLCENGLLVIKEISENKSVNNEIVKISGDGTYTYVGRMLSFKIYKTDNICENIANVHKKFANCCMDYDKIKGEILIHKRKEGDFIQLVNRNFRSDVRKLVNKAFPADKRDNLIILYDDDGVVFVEGYGVCDRVKITEKTQQILAFSTDNII